jgi:hypothetical protein
MVDEGSDKWLEAACSKEIALVVVRVFWQLKV